MSDPAEIWLDPRVIRSINTEPDPEIPLVRYRSDQRVGELLTQAGGDEFFIQIELSNGGIMFALTNYGRLFRQSVGAPSWEIVDVPDFGGSPEP